MQSLVVPRHSSSLILTGAASSQDHQVLYKQHQYLTIIKAVLGMLLG